MAIHRGFILSGGVALYAHLRRLAVCAIVVGAIFVPLGAQALPTSFAANATPSATLGIPTVSVPGSGPSATAIPPTASSATPLPLPELTLPQHYVVLIVIDASRPSYLALTKLPHIQTLMQNGVVYDRAWVGQLDSATPDVHVTFGTGTMPRENGFLGFTWAAPQTRASIDFRTLLADHQIDPVLQALPVPGVAARLQQYIPQAVSVAASGHKDYAVVGLGGGTSTYELYGKFYQNQFMPAFMHSPPPLTRAERKSLTLRSPLNMGGEDAWAFQYTIDVVKRVRPRLLMINLPEVDTWGHWYGPDDSAVFSKLMLNIDRGIGQLQNTYRQLGILDRTDFIITADHAMMESHGATNWSSVLATAQSVGTSVARSDTESGAIWLKDPTKARAMARKLVASKPDHVAAIFYRSSPGLDYSYVLASPANWLANRQAETVFQYLVNTTAGRDGPDVWVLYREGYTVVPRNVKGTWKGTHGGASWQVQNIPLILSGPDIRRGEHSPFPARAIDIAPTMERLLGLPPVKRDGVILADALANPSRGELRNQEAVAPTVDGYVAGLIAESKADERNRSIWPALPSPPFRCTVGPVAPTPPRGGCRITRAVDANQ